MEKTCRKCGIVLTSENCFPSYIKRNNYICHKCNWKARKEHPNFEKWKERRKELNRIYYGRHKEIVKLKVKNWKIEHRNYIMNLSDEEFLDLIYPNRRMVEKREI